MTRRRSLFAETISGRRKATAQHVRACCRGTVRLEPGNHESMPGLARRDECQAQAVQDDHRLVLRISIGIKGRAARTNLPNNLGMRLESGLRAGSRIQDADSDCRNRPPWENVRVALRSTPWAGCCDWYDHHVMHCGPSFGKEQYRQGYTVSCQSSFPLRTKVTKEVLWTVRSQCYCVCTVHRMPCEVRKCGRGAEGA